MERRNIMNRIKAIAILAIANFVVAGSSFAQDHRVQVQIPFDFTVSGKLLPKGNYIIKKSAENIIEIRNHDKPISSLALVNHDGQSAPGYGVVTFHRYGDRYFLSQILSDSAGMSLHLPTSKKERATQLQQATVNQPSLTLVAAR
jgi:hypothetical protein